MKRRTFLSTLAAAGLITSLKPSLVHAEPQRISQQGLADLLQITEVPGIAISGIVSGRPVQQIQGFRVNPQPEGPGSQIQLTTYFPSASLTKPVFAWAVLDLIRQGKLELRKPLQDYLDLGLSWEAARITPQFVLTHTTGCQTGDFNQINH